MILFVDTSVLVKLYLAEPGSERMRKAVMQEDGVAASLLAFAEIHAAFARRRREGQFQAGEFSDLRGRLGEDWKDLMKIPVGAEIVALVPGLCDRHPLRGADAVHLASALLLQKRGLDILFACSDGALLAAAAAEGLAIFDPTRES